MYFRHQVEAMRVQILWFAANHAKQDHCSVLLCSNNRSKSKLGITFHHFQVDKYAKENWTVRIRRYVGKNFRLVIVVYDFKLCKLYLKSVCSGLVCNHTRDNEIGRPRSGSTICLSRV